MDEGLAYEAKNLCLALQLRRTQPHHRSTRSWVERFQLTSVLSGHQGCVNSIRWSSDGGLLISGSDDRMLHLWRLGPRLSESVRPAACLPTLHRRNIFDARVTADMQSIVSCGADGCVCLTSVHTGQQVRLYEPETGHFSAFKLSALSDSGGGTFYVSFGDGFVRQFDLRQNNHAIAVNTNRVGLAGLSVNPLRRDILAVGGDDPFLRLYDIRRLCMHAEPLPTTELPLTPAISLHSTEQMIRLHRRRAASPSLSKPSDVGISGVSWSADGQSILANYRGGEIELFSSKSCADGEGERAVCLPSETRNEMTLPTSSVHLNSRQSFSGRMNEQTCTKEAQFLCGESAVGSGGDCGNLFIWDTLSGALVRKFRADRCTVNCVAPHPVWPLIAVSGIDSEIKIFDTIGLRGDEQQDSRRHATLASASLPVPELQEPGDTAAQEAAVREGRSLEEHGHELARQGDWISALPLYDQALGHLCFVPSSEKLSKDKSMLELSCHLHSAFCYLNLEEFDSAVAHCDSAIQLDGRNSLAFCRRAIALGGIFNFQAACLDLDTAARLDPENADIDSIRSKLKKQEKRYLKGRQR